LVAPGRGARGPPVPPLAGLVAGLAGPRSLGLAELLRRLSVVRSVVRPAGRAGARPAGRSSRSVLLVGRPERAAGRPVPLVARPREGPPRVPALDRAPGPEPSRLAEDGLPEDGLPGRPVPSLRGDAGAAPSRRRVEPPDAPEGRPLVPSLAGRGRADDGRPLLPPAGGFRPPPLPPRWAPPLRPAPPLARPLPLRVPPPPVPLRAPGRAPGARRFDREGSAGIGRV
ncbi:MAG TPA: hypothetical protein VN886_09580, partial [Acidimicrobiales bacterium]|nr:hypothetical protein [Acidimicrobiales bacterium]